jgi:Holliday junction resolvasome RuvABC DNA-binding subunit
VSAVQQARSALCHLGFGRVEVARVLARLSAEGPACDTVALVRAALVYLTPKLSCA